MRKKIKALLKNQKGFTLVELLAVIVILGIIGAIAVPSISNIIDNSKKDAHIANAKQMVAAARLAVAANDTTTLGSDTDTVTTDSISKYEMTMEELTNGGYLEGTIKDPDGSTYVAANSKVIVTQNVSTGAIGYTVFLDGTRRDIGTSAAPVTPESLNRGSVQ